MNRNVLSFGKSHQYKGRFPSGKIPCPRNMTSKIPNSTTPKKEDAWLSPMDSLKAPGFEQLAEQIATMVKESWTREPEGPPDFDAREWLAYWMIQPVKSLGYTRPIEYMNTKEGRERISTLFKQFAYGVYV
jgi:Protein of unknown function (DUF2384)